MHKRICVFKSTRVHVDVASETIMATDLRFSQIFLFPLLHLLHYFYRKAADQLCVIVVFCSHLKETRLQDHCGCSDFGRSNDCNHSFL